VQAQGLSDTGLVLWRGEELVPVGIWSHVRTPVQSKIHSKQRLLVTTE